MQKIKTPQFKKIYTPMFTAVPFTIAQTWKQPKRPLKEEWVKMI